jgi:glycosyltransferase involved in cell wall biosynthesis
MSAFDALVLPSHTAKGWKEQFGRVLVEAMSCGTPPIGSDSGEIPIVIGDAGLVVPEGQAMKFRDAILTLFHDPGLRERLANKGRERVLQSFTHANLASQTVKAYEAAIESGCG